MSSFALKTYLDMGQLFSTYNNTKIYLSQSILNMPIFGDMKIQQKFGVKPKLQQSLEKPLDPIFIRTFLSISVLQRPVSQKPKQLSLPVVLFPKKGANKYSHNVYSLSVTLQHNHLQFWTRGPDYTICTSFCIYLGQTTVTI